MVKAGLQVDANKMAPPVNLLKQTCFVAFLRLSNARCYSGQNIKVLVFGKIINLKFKS